VPEFHPFTIEAACKVLATFYKTNDAIEALVFGWGCDGIAGSGYMSSKFLSIARAAASDDVPRARTESGDMSLARALVEEALKAPEAHQETPSWVKLVAGLKFDGFELEKKTVPDPRGRQSLFSEEKPTKVVWKIRRMLPEDIPGVDFREAESEVVSLLGRHGFTVALGHLEQALSAFGRGEWSSANGEFRKFYESYLNEIADRLGYDGSGDSKAKRDFLAASLNPPFLLEKYNEWHPNKTQFVQGLMNRMHPHGGHAGLSEEEDATFRLQIILVTARLLLRRFDNRLSSV